MPMHIIVCSRNSVVVGTLTWAFDGHGHRLTVCESGLDVLGAVEVIAADLLIVDMETPGLNGLLLVSAVRELAPALPIVAVSTRSEVADARALAQRGVTCAPLPAGGDGAPPSFLNELAQAGAGGRVRAVQA